MHFDRHPRFDLQPQGGSVAFGVSVLGVPPLDGDDVMRVASSHDVHCVNSRSSEFFFFIVVSK